MTARIAVVLACGLVALGPASAASVRRPRMTRSPRVGRPKPYAAPKRERFRLANGLNVVLVRDARTPLVTLRMIFAGGSGHFARNTPGMIEAMAALMTEGTTSRNARQIAEEADAFGGSVQVTPTTDHVVVRAFGLSEKLGPLLGLTAEVVAAPSFPEDEVDLRKKNMLEELRLKRSQPDFLARVAFRRQLYHPHPYGILAPTEEAVDRIDRMTLVALHQRLFTVPNALLIVVGDVEREALESTAMEAFAQWTHKPALPLWKLPAPKLKTERRRVVLVERPGSAQAVLRVGNLAVTRNNEDYFPLLVANQVLGGSFASRLSMDLREDKGYTYGITSRLPIHRSAGAFEIASSVRNEVVRAALDSVLEHLERMRRTSVRYRELRQAKRMLIGRFVRSLETQAGVADAVLLGVSQDLPDDWLDTYVDQIQSVSAGDVKRAARAYLRPDEALISIVGDSAALESALEGLTESAIGRVDVNGLLQGSL